jgi:hypothetical protein
MLYEPVNFGELPLGDAIVNFEEVSISPNTHYIPKVLPHTRQYAMVDFNAPVYQCSNGQSHSVSIIADIQSIRQLGELRALFRYEYSRFTLGKFFQSLLFTKDKGEVDLIVPFFSGLMSATLLPEATTVIYDEAEVDAMAITYPKDASTIQSTQINGSTPKLCEVLSSVVQIIKHSSVFSNVDATRRERFLSSMKRVMILGATGMTDPIAYGLRALFNSTVRQIGALGTGNVLRGLLQAVELSQGYQTVISDIDFTTITSDASFDAFVTGTLIDVLNLIRPVIFIWKIQYGTYRVLQRTFSLLHGLGLPYHAYVIRSTFSHVGNFECYLVLLQPFLDVDATTNFLPPESLRSQLPLQHGILDVTKLTLEKADVLGPVLLRPRDQMISVGTFDLRHIKSNLSILMRYMSGVRISRVGYGADAVYHGRVSLTRQKLTYRTNVPYELLPDIPHRLSPSTIGLQRGQLQPHTVGLSLGNFIRALTREIMMCDIQRRHSYATDFARTPHSFCFLGVGDENARNINSVFLNSRYVVIDPRVNSHFTHYGVEVAQHLFSWDLAGMQQAVQAYKRTSSSIIIFCIFMLMNDEPTKPELQLRLRHLGQLFQTTPFIDSIYFNVYISNPVQNILFLESDTSGRSRVSDDMYIGRDEITQEIKLTFSERYGLTSTLTAAEVEVEFQLPVETNAVLQKLSISDEAIYSLRERDGIVCGQAGASCLELGYASCPLWRLSRISQ